MKKYYVIPLMIFLFATSCQQPENLESLDNGYQNQVVQPEIALTTARNFNAVFSVTKGRNGEKKSRVSDGEKTVKQVTPFKDQGKPVYYVIT